MPPAATVVLEQLDASTRHVDHVKQPAAEHILTPLDLILTEDDRCSYVSPEGEACGTKRVKESRYQARHWITCHAMEEVSQIERHHLDMAKAKIITTEQKMKTAIEYRTWCPLCLQTSHTKTGPQDFYVRDDSLVRHMVGCAKKRNVELSRTNANEWVRKNMGVFRPHREFRSGYLAAVWRIYHAS